MKKRLTLVLALVLLLSMSATAFATQDRASENALGLSFNGTTAVCSATVRSLGDDITATMELWLGNVMLDSWSGSDVGIVMLDGTHDVTRGHTYTLKLHGMIDGKFFVATPVSKTLF